MKQRETNALTQTIQAGYGNTVGVVVQKNGETLYEQYFNGFAPTGTMHVASVTKSVVSALFGIALAQGHIQSLEQTVLEFFPGYTPPAGERVLQTVTLRQLLTMTAPYKYEEEPYLAFFQSPNWTMAALDLLGGQENTGEFLYSAIVGSHLLSGILARATGMPMREYAVRHLFSPLGIEAGPSIMLSTEEQHHAFFAQNPKGWAADEQGVNTAGWGLTLTARDMAKIGRLYAGEGAWQGRQIVPAQWVAESTCPHARWGQLQYGYLWWVLRETPHIYAAMGDGGNVIYVNTQNGLVVALLAAMVPDARDRIELIETHIEPLFGAAP